MLSQSTIHRFPFHICGARGVLQSEMGIDFSCVSGFAFCYADVSHKSQSRDRNISHKHIYKCKPFSLLFVVATGVTNDSEI